ncbi:hypothetical protein NC651_029480 [Populus alba x Populus x berolinensis]|nr:hypothetical protein NC651_029480 [Populus alba x Populus x berolinensis]
MPWRINKAIDFRHDSSNGLGAGRGFSDSCVPVEDIALINAKKESKGEHLHFEISLMDQLHD